MKNFPTQLITEEYFKCPIWWADQPKFVNKLNKASDSYIKAFNSFLLRYLCIVFILLKNRVSNPFVLKRV